MAARNKDKKNNKVRVNNTKKSIKAKKVKSSITKTKAIKKDAPKKTRSSKNRGLKKEVVKASKKINVTKIKTLKKNAIKVGKIMKKASVKIDKKKIVTKNEIDQKIEEKECKKSSRKNKMNIIWCTKLLKDPMMRRWLINSVGEHAIHVIQQFNQEMSDEEVAKKSGIRPSDVRVVLNKMHSYGLASYSRNKDKKSGWYSYVWTLHEDRALELYNTMKNKFSEIKSDDRIKGQEYYYCVVNGKKEVYTFEQAIQLNFRCPTTGQALKYLE
jgi:transcription initiation factor TFIIE subunit alpha